MSEARIGRVVVAALHEALGDRLPLRLEFYESYLRPWSMRTGTIGIASFLAALSFLRAENGEYDRVVREAGRLAADWTFQETGRARRAVWARLPEGVRARAAMALTRSLARRTSRTMRARLTSHGRRRYLVIDGSLFCETRRPADAPGCGFYAAALDRFCELLGVRASATIAQCRALGDASCSLGIASPGESMPAISEAGERS